MTTPLQAHRVETTLTQDGTLTLDGLPFEAGEAVEVIVLPGVPAYAPPNRYPLRGTPVRYQRPAALVDDVEWDAAHFLLRGVKAGPFDGV